MGEEAPAGPVAREAELPRMRTPTVHTDFPGGQLGPARWVGPGHLRATLYREWDENRINTQATWYYFRL